MRSSALDQRDNVTVFPPGTLPLLSATAKLEMLGWTARGRASPWATLGATHPRAPGRTDTAAASQTPRRIPG